MPCLLRYLVRWEMEIAEGEKWETWEPYSELLVKGTDGEMEIHKDVDAQVTTRQGSLDHPRAST